MTPARDLFLRMKQGGYNSGRVYHVVAPSERAKEEWVEALIEAVAELPDDALLKLLHVTLLQRLRHHVSMWLPCRSP